MGNETSTPAEGSPGNSDLRMSDPAGRLSAVHQISMADSAVSRSMGAPGMTRGSELMDLLAQGSTDVERDMGGKVDAPTAHPSDVEFFIAMAQGKGIPPSILNGASHMLRMSSKFFMRVDQQGCIVDSYTYPQISKIEVGTLGVTLWSPDFSARYWKIVVEDSNKFVDAFLIRAAQYGQHIVPSKPTVDGTWTDGTLRALQGAADTAAFSTLCALFVKLWRVHKFRKIVAKHTAKSREDGTLKKVKTRTAVLNELMVTEETYHRELLILDHCFIRKIEEAISSRNREATPPGPNAPPDQLPPTIVQHDWDDFVQVLRQLVTVHDHTAGMLKDQIKTHGGMGKLGDISFTFANLCMVTLQSLYPRYLSRQMVVSQALQGHPGWTAFLRQCQRTRKLTVELDLGAGLEEVILDTKGMGFASYIITPVRRMAAYVMLLERLLKNTEQSHKFIGQLRAANSSVAKVGQQIDNLVKTYSQVENMQKVFTLPHENFKIEDRSLVLEGCLLYQLVKLAPARSSSNEDSKGFYSHNQKHQQEQGNIMCKVYLLTDLIIVTQELRAGEMEALAKDNPDQKGKSERILQRITLNNAGAGVSSEVKFEVQGDNIIQLESPIQGVHQFQFHDDEDLQKWVKTLEEVLATIKNQETIRKRKNQAAAAQRKEDSTMVRSITQGPQIVAVLDNVANRGLRRASSFEEALERGVSRRHFKERRAAPDKKPEDTDFKIRISSEKLESILRLTPRYMLRLDEQGMVIDSHKYSHIEKIQMADQGITIFFVAYIQHKGWTATSNDNQGLVDALVEHAKMFGHSIKVEEIKSRIRRGAAFQHGTKRCVTVL